MPPFGFLDPSSGLSGSFLGAFWILPRGFLDPSSGPDIAQTRTIASLEGAAAPSVGWSNAETTLPPPSRRRSGWGSGLQADRRPEPKVRRVHPRHRRRYVA